MTLLVIYALFVHFQLRSQPNDRMPETESGAYPMLLGKTWVSAFHWVYTAYSRVKVELVYDLCETHECNLQSMLVNR